MDNRDIGRAGFMQFFYYFAYAAGANYFTLYYKGLLLDSSGEPLYGVIGTILLAQALVAFLSPLIAGYFADRYQITNRLISLCSFGTALGAVLFVLPGLGILADLSLSSRLFLIFPGAMISNFFVKPLVPLIDTGTMKALESKHGDANLYGRIRMAGSIGWILCCLATGVLVDATGELVHSLIIYVICFIGLGLIASRGFATSVKKVDLPLHLLGEDKTLRVIVGITFLRMFGFGMAFQYTGVFLSELNMTYTQMGMAFGLAATLEIPFFYLGHRFLSRFGGKKLIMGDLFLQIVRFGIFFFFPHVQNLYFYVLVQMLMGLGVSLFLTGALPLLNSIAPEKLKASYMNIYSVSMAVANIFTGFIASLIVMRWGARSLMGICALITVVTLLYTILRLNDPRSRADRKVHHE